MKFEIKVPKITGKPSKSSAKSDWWIWAVSIVFVLAGATLVILFSILLYKSYSGGKTSVAAYAGAIGTGVAAMIAAVTQIIVFVHKKHDEKQKRLEKAEHDYTNFFIKNYEYNELILLVLEQVVQKLNVVCKTAEEGAVIEMHYSSTYSNLSNLRSAFVKELVNEVYNNSELGNMLMAKYSLTGGLSSSLISKLFSCLDTEIKKTLNSLEKLLLNLHNDQYDKDYYFNKIKLNSKRFFDALLPYLILVIVDNTSHASVENYPYFIYSIVKKG
jgi:hypothetical protein